MICLGPNSTALSTRPLDLLYTVFENIDILTKCLYLAQKTFTPTIPVRRKKPTAPLPSPSVDEGILNGRERERERRGKERAGRGGKRERDIITSASIFSMGPAEKHMQKRGNTVGAGNKPLK